MFASFFPGTLEPVQDLDQGMQRKAKAAEKAQHTLENPYTNRALTHCGVKVVSMHLDRYEIQEPLGQGAMAEVFKAYDRRMERVVAIKLLRKDRSVDTYFRSRLVREAQAVAKIPHPNIVTVYDAGELENRPYIVMELLAGMFLDEWLRFHQTCPWQDVVTIGAQLASALVQAHDKGIIHRDIKPANIIWQDDKQIAKLADFGIAHIETANTAYTQAGQLIGTPQYMSPEQIQGKPADARSDLFSLGVVLYHLLTGQRPFNGESLAALAYQITQATPTAIEKSGTKAPKGLIQIVNKLLSKSPRQRHQSARELLTDLEAFRDGKQSTSKRVPLWSTAAAAGLVLSGTAAWFLLPSPEPKPVTPFVDPVKAAALANSGSKPSHPVGLSEQQRAEFSRMLEQQLKLDCSNIRVTVTGDGTAQLRGFVPKDEDFVQVQDIVEAQLQKIADTQRVKINPQYELPTLPWPQCQAAAIIAGYWSKNLSEAAGLKVRANSRPVVDDPIELGLTTPGYESYLYIDFYLEGGTVKHLYAAENGKSSPASTALTLGQNQRWHMPPESMTCLIVVLASAKPLLDSRRQRTESTESYIKYLHKMLAQNEEKIVADYTIFKTGQRF